MNTIAIVGASGYIGRHLVSELARVGHYRIKILTRQKATDLADAAWPSNVEVIYGDLEDPESLSRLLEPDITVVNLVYLWNVGELKNLAITSALLEACKIGRVKRLIHCSTAAVVGRVPNDEVVENTDCRPITEYGITKLKIEQLIVSTALGHFDAVILRPTGVFGPGGEPLRKLANDLVNGSRLRNYFKSCLFGRRRMNLVHIANVVAAIQFLVQRSEHIDGEIYIVSDDDEASNNFADIEQFLMRTLDCANYALPRISLPLGVLSLLLRCLGRNNINPRCNYIQGKLQSLGFNSPVAFEDGLAEYAAWYRTTYVEGKSGVAE
jgi:nucleoside-diphosphate-sugar epimerase